MRIKTILFLAALLLIAVPTFAQESSQTTGGPTGLLAVPFAMAIASGLCGLAQGRAVSSAAEAIARNPGAAGAIRILLLLGLAFIESLALFTFVKVG